jgi:CHAT domain-containing protein/tetratricopeptide (TPR) repeat protein
MSKFTQATRMISLPEWSKIWTLWFTIIALVAVGIAPTANAGVDEELASIYDAIGKLQQKNDYLATIPLASRAVQLLQSDPQLPAIRIADAYEALGVGYGGSQQPGPAESNFEKAIGVLDTIGGGDPIRLSALLRNLGLERLKMRKYQEAIPPLERALKLRELIQPLVPLLVASSSDNLATTLQDLTRHSEAEPLLRRSLALREASLEASDPLIARTLQKLAYAIGQQKRAAETVLLYQRALEISARNEKISRNDIFEYSTSLATALSTLGRNAEAELVWRRALSFTDAATVADHTTIGRLSNGLGSVLRSLERLPEGRDVLMRAVALSTGDGQEHGWLVWTHLELGLNFLVDKNFTESTQQFQRALDLSVGRNLDSIYLEAIVSGLAASLHETRQYELAAPLMKRAISIREKIFGPSSDQVLSGYKWWIFNAERSGRLKEIVRDFEVAIASRDAQLGRHDSGTADVLETGGRRFGYYSGTLQEADAMLKRAVSIREAVRPIDSVKLKQSRATLFSFMLMQGRYAEAEQLAKRMVDAAAGPTADFLPDALDNLGAAYLKQGRLVESEAVNRRALNLLLKNGAMNKRLSEAYFSLGAPVLLLGNLREARRLLERALEIRASVNLVFDANTADIYHQLAVLSGQEGDQAKSLEWNLKALSLREAVHPNSANVALSLQNIAAVHGHADRIDLAIDFGERAFKLYEKIYGISSPEASNARQNLGFFYEKSGDLTKAYSILKLLNESSIEHARRIGSELASVAPGISGDSHIRMARRGFLTEIQVAWRLATASPWPPGNFNRSAFFAAQWASRSMTARTFERTAAMRASGDAEFERIMVVREDLVKEWRSIDRMASIAATASAEGSVEFIPTFETQRVAQIRALLDGVDAKIKEEFPAFRNWGEPEPVTVTEVRELLRPNEVLIQILVGDGSKAEGDTINVWAIEGGAKDTGLHWHVSAPKQGELLKLVSALRCGVDDTAWAGAGGAGCGALLKRGKKGTDLPFDPKIAHELYKMVVGPLGPVIAGKQLIIVPSGPFTRVPFQTLLSDAQNGNFGRAEMAKAKWLGTTNAITVLPATSSLRALRKGAKPSFAARPFLAFANPLLDGNGWGSSALANAARKKQSCPRDISRVAQSQVVASMGPFRKRGVLRTRGVVTADEVRKLSPLPDTADEACEVADRLGAGVDDVFLGQRASKAALQKLSASGLADYNVLLFATHGLVSKPDGTLQGRLVEPALVLTPSPIAARSSADATIDNGLLTMSEIMTLKLDADWVILSACNSAAGMAQDAETFSGLARAFFFAGARTVLVSHWEVYSKASVDLIGRTFGNMRADPAIGRAEAMRLAMRDVIANDPFKGRLKGFSAHPAYWAPFALVGEGGVGLSRH